ncbi:hypothetical protein K466DRAFT_337830 [Polyporus arcularius HHB13444]|uniref:Uncharacterized protein n=1 Tax=Polyporus arcularius HHB13444 TaxID=1314778 RepID=A0A5C3PNS7_9APHY|nr:hypothetical protein K466DRAFT_337830 [Polyporus arcularius HHB13444]
MWTRRDAAVSCFHEPSSGRGARRDCQAHWQRRLAGLRNICCVFGHVLCAWDANRILIGTGTTPDNLANASRYTPMASFRSWTWPGPGALGEFETLPPCRWLPQPPVPHLEPSRKLAQSWWPHMCTDLLLRSAFLLLASMRRAASVKGVQHHIRKFAHTCKPEQGSSRTSVREGPEQLQDATRGWILKIAGEGPAERFQRRPGRSAPPAHELRARRRPSSNVKP